MKKSLLLTLMLLILSNCGGVNCVKIVEDYKKDKLWIVFIENQSKESYHYFKIKGKNKSNEDTIYAEENRYFCEYKNKFEIGDTLIKNNGETIFSIHKKDTILSFPFECDGKVYK